MDGRDSDAVHQPGQRTGTADRQAAVDALGEHARAGRLTPQEYEERSQTAKAAMTWAQIGELFDDLPAPHPAPDPARHPDTARRPDRLAERGTGNVEAGLGLVPRHIGVWLVALAPFIALGLFLKTGEWWYFLLIPIVSMVVYGPRERRR